LLSAFDRKLAESGPAIPTEEDKLQYPDKYPRFPRAGNARGEYNQKEEKTAISARLECVVECGQCRNWFLERG
jgi:hypothetical protein